MNEVGLPGIPKRWIGTNLEDCVEILDSRRIPVNAKDRENRHGNIPYYGATGQVGWIDDFIFDEELVLLGEDGAPFLDPFKPKAYVIKGKSWVNNHAHVLKAISGITLNSFLCSYLNIFDYHGYVAGTTRLKLNQVPMRGIPFPLPPLSEQHRIVSKIEELFTKLDAGVEALKKVKAQLKRYRQAVLKYAFEGKLTQEWREANKDKLEPASVFLERIKEERKKKAGEKFKESSPLDTADLPELPEGWIWARTGDLYDIIGGGTPSTEITEYWEGDIPWITSADIMGLKDIRPRKYINKKAIANSATNLVPEGSLIVVTRVGLGKIALNKIPLCFSQDSQALVGITGLHYQDYSLYFLSQAVQIFKYRHRGTTIAGVTKKQLAELPFALPSLEEQRKITDEIETRLSASDEIEKIIDPTLKQSVRLRQSILKNAFEGKLVPQDPTDEPAEKLLERIKAEKAKKESGTKSRRKKSNQVELI